MKADSRGLRASLHVLAGLTVLLVGAPSLGASKERLPGVVVEGSRVYDPEKDGDPVINNLERRTFRFFWDTTNRQNGLAPDRFPSPSFASTWGVERCQKSSQIARPTPTPSRDGTARSMSPGAKKRRSSNSP